MFDLFRKYNKFALAFLFLLIIPSFVLFGVERYTQSGSREERVAEVDGQAITKAEWEARHRSEIDRIRRQAPNIDAALLDSEGARYATLESMVRERVLAAAAAKAHLSVSEERLARLFAQDPGIATFRGADGKFDRDAFTRATGQTPEQYEAAVRSQLATQQVLLGVAGTAFAPPALANALLDPVHGRREVQVARFDPAEFKSRVQINDADLEAWYKAHAGQFQAPEAASIEYLVLDIETVKKGIAVNDAELRSYYEQNKDRLGTKEERRASHILIAAPAGAPAAEREKARAKAEQLRADVLKVPDSFADVARKNSQDPGSAERGGDLDFVTRGAMVKPFEDALFALKKGEVSPVIETEFGYHVIKLTDVKPGVVPPFEQVRATLENEVRAQQAAQEFAKAAETFTDLVYQQADSLQPAADKLKLAVQKASGVGPAPAQGATGALASRNFLAALYAPESRDRKNNTEAIEVGPSQLAAGRVVQYTPARTVPFEQVKDKVRDRLVAERAAALAKAEGSARLAAWQADAKGARFDAPVTVSRAEPQSQPVPVVEAALRADPGKLPALIGVDLGAQGYEVVRVNKALPRTPPATGLAEQERTQVAQAVAAAESAAYYDLLKQRFEARILAPAPSAATKG